MRDIVIGLVIIFVAFLIIDFIYTEKNTCLIKENNSEINTEVKCGVIKNELDIDINLFGRYW